MHKIEKFLRKLSSVDRYRIGFILEMIVNRRLEGLDIKKLKGKNFYRIRKGKFRIIFTFDKNKEIILYDIKIRNDTTYKF